MTVKCAHLVPLKVQSAPNGAARSKVQLLKSGFLQLPAFCCSVPKLMRHAGCHFDERPARWHVPAAAARASVRCRMQGPKESPSCATAIGTARMLGASAPTSQSLMPGSQLLPEAAELSDAVCSKCLLLHTAGRQWNTCTPRVFCAAACMCAALWLWGLIPGNHRPLLRFSAKHEPHVISLQLRLNA